MRRVRLSIEHLDSDGRGVGPWEGRRLHVAGALPGETAWAHVEHVSPHGGRAWGRLDVLEGAPSPDRVPPACPAAARCGGCALSHLAYPAQVHAKRARLVQALAGVVDEARIAACVPAPATTGWRDRVKYVVGGARGRVVLGSFAPASHELVDMRGCAVPEPAIARLTEPLRRLLDGSGLPVYDERRRTGELRHLVLRANAAGQVLALVVTRSAEAIPALRPRTEALVAAEPALAGVVLQENAGAGGTILGEREHRLAGVSTIDETVGPVRLRLSASAFFQVHRAQAAAMYARVADELAAAPGARLVDLYSGVGGIALTLAARGARVVGVETVAPAVDDARAAARASGLAAEFLLADAADGLPRAIAALGGVDGLCVDPPRKGLLPAARAALLAARPPRLCYVACGPEALARDLAELTDTYTITAVLPYDLMPGTPEVEAIATLVLR